jgi:hypothetical protein
LPIWTSVMPTSPSINDRTGEPEVQLGLTYGAARRFNDRFGRAVSWTSVELVLWDRPRPASGRSRATSLGRADAHPRCAP